MIDTTIGIESVTWYQTEQSDRRRIVITFQDGLRHGPPTKLPGEIELYGDSVESPLGRMSVDSPEALDELAYAIKVAAQHWRHLIEECECFDKVEGKIISFGDFQVDIPLDLSDGDDDADDPEA